MARWRDGAPLQLYLVVTNDMGRLYAFSSVRERADFVARENMDAEMYTLRTYVQKENK